MGKNAIVKMYQTARFMEWIGNFDKAEDIYKEIEQSENVLSNILLPTIISKKKKLEAVKDTELLPHEVGIVMVERQEPKLLFKAEDIKPKKTNIGERFNNTYSLWDYSISVVSKVDTDLRLIIKGYSLIEKEPNLGFLNDDLLSDWKIKEIKSEPYTNRNDLIWLIANNTEYSAEIFLSIDRWGLLNGTIIVSEKSLGDTLSSIHLLLVDLSRRVWKG